MQVTDASHVDGAGVLTVGWIGTEQREAALTQEGAPLELELKGHRDLVPMPQQGHQLAEDTHVRTISACLREQFAHYGTELLGAQDAAVDELAQGGVGVSGHITTLSRHQVRVDA